MKLSWKSVGTVLAGLIGVVVIAAGLFVAFFPKELAAREAERRIEAATGRDLQLNGAINITFWPALGFSVEQASLSNPRDFDSVARRGGVEAAATPFIAADRIVFAVAVMPLLRGDIQVRQLIFQGAELRLRAKPDGSANWTFPTEQNSQQQTTLEDLRLDDVRLIDSLVSFQGGDDEPPLTIEHVDASLKLDSLDQPAQVQSEFDYRGQRLKVDATIGLPRAVIEKGQTPFEANVDGDLIDAAFAGTFNAESGALQGQFDAEGASLRQVMAWQGSPMGPGTGFAAYQLHATMAHEGDQTALTHATLSIDNIAATGNLTLINQADHRLRVNGALSSANIDLNTYLPPPAQGAHAGGVEVDTAWSRDPIDFSGFRAIDSDLDLTIAALKFQNLRFSNVTMHLRIANGAADARLSRIALYGGSGTARMIADGSGAIPRVAVELDAQNVQAEPLLRDALGFDKITGRGRVRASLLSAGVSQAAIMRGLRGSSTFSFNDGQWKGVNLAQIARTIQSALTGSEAGAGGGATDFSEMGATFQISQGIAATDNLHLLSPFVRLDGSGLVDVGAQTLDMRISPRAVRSAEGQGGSALLPGLGIPFRITGPWSRPSFRPDLDDVVQNQVRSRIQDALRNQQPGSPLAQLSETIFGTPTPAAPAPTPAPGAPQPAPSAQPPAAQPQPSSNPLEDALRRAVERNTRDKQAPPPAPAPSP